MKTTKCNQFCNYHCSTSDCPNIQCDTFEDRYDLPSSEIGLERVDCKNCEYSDKNCDCDDCLFKGSANCPMPEPYHEDIPMEYFESGEV